MPPITPLEFLSIHPSSPFEIFHAPFRDANSLRARIIERVASSSEYLPAGSRYVFKITFLRVPPTCYYRQVSSAASAPTRGPITRLCDDEDDDDDASLHLRAYLPRLLSISSIFLLRNGGNEGNEDGEAGMEEGKERERMPCKRCRLFPFK